MRNPPSPSASPAKNEDTLRGFGFAMSAYLFWGFLPLFMKLVVHIPAPEVVAHRVVWSVPIAALVLFLLGRTGDIGRVLRDPQTLAMGCVTAALVSVNWGIYVWAISVDRTLDAALGYYINPLFSVFLGSMLLGERLNRLQWAAVGLAAGAVVVLAVSLGSLPWPALLLTTTWGFYAYFKRSLPIGPNQGFLLEVLILTPFALAYIIWLLLTGSSHFEVMTYDMWLLMGCGVATAVPLLLYANGAKGLRLTTIGIMQYIAPTLIMLVAVFVFKEPFGPARAVAFPMIWAALALYTFAMFRGRRA